MGEHVEAISTYRPAVPPVDQPGDPATQRRRDLFTLPERHGAKVRAERLQCGTELDVRHAHMENRKAMGKQRSPGPRCVTPSQGHPGDRTPIASSNWRWCRRGAGYPDLPAHRPTFRTRVCQTRGQATGSSSLAHGSPGHLERHHAWVTVAAASSPLQTCHRVRRRGA